MRDLPTLTGLALVLLLSGCASSGRSNDPPLESDGGTADNLLFGQAEPEPGEPRVKGQFTLATYDAGRKVEW
jgi:hypothetical protein